MKPKIYSFRYHHEHRNDWLRFGLMQLHKAGQINYIEKPLIKASKYGFSKDIANGNHRHISFMLFVLGKIKKKIIIDSEDSFVFLSTFISECDYYFISGYNSDFFEKKQVLAKYDWQNEHDIKWYNKIISEKIYDLGIHFHKVRKFIPIGPNLTYPINRSFINQKIINIKSRFSSLFFKKNYWQTNYKEYSLRYDYLISLRGENLTFDIVLNDSLWGWPKHRIRLHNKLKTLSKQGYKICSILNWSEPNISDNSLNLSWEHINFPMKTGQKIYNYELMLSKSKIGVFATGFHFGWRNIMAFCLMVGIPVLVDKLKLEPYFDISKFILYENDDADWNSIAPILNRINKEDWLQMKKKNRLYYDEVMSPIAVANYFLETIKNT